MNKLYSDIESIEIPVNILPKNEDYKRGHCLYKLNGYMQPKYVLYDEPLNAFKEDSEIYKFGISILNKFKLSPNEWTLIYNNNTDWISYFKLEKLN